MPRLTRSGRFIRRLKLDELSQLVNVLLGQMSLVGPRPEVVDKLERYSDGERRVLAVRPGITDWASIWNSDEGAVVAGAPDPDEAYEKVIRPTKLKLQLDYCRNRSFLGDLKIIVFTLVKILRRGFVPKELRQYPTCEQLRAEVQKLMGAE